MTTPKGKAGRETDGVRDATPKVKPAREVRSTVARSQSARRELPEAREPREPREREQREVWRDSRRQETAKETAKRRQEPIREPRKETGRTPREPPAQKSPLRQRQAGFAAPRDL